jgi:hypothetical protein
MCTDMKDAIAFAVARVVEASPLAQPSALSPNSTPVEYRGIRYTIRAGIERDQWSVAIYPAGDRDEGESHHRITQGGRIGGSRHHKKLAEKALRRKIKVKLTRSHSLWKVKLVT